MTSCLHEPITRRLIGVTQISFLPIIREVKIRSNIFLLQHDRGKITLLMMPLKRRLIVSGKKVS